MNRMIMFANLHDGEEDKTQVLERVRNNISFRGSQLWILACAIVVASVGLNVNSTAVIIGAMLISPLMGPVVGTGFALGTLDVGLLKRSFKNLLIATIVSLMVSAIYFFISPFKEIQSELLARTTPTIYDVIIAFFGGLVGVIAVTRFEKGNPIPGVAIATALMPPLCTAGYGLAIGNLILFLEALYLYTINCVFICIATFVIVKYLKYPELPQVDHRHKQQIKYGMTGIMVVMIVPSIYFAYNLFEEKSYNKKIETFIANEFTDKGYVVIYKRTRIHSNPRALELAFLDKRLDEKEMRSLTEKLKLYDLRNTTLFIKQDTSDLKNDILNEIGFGNKALDEKDKIINYLNKELAFYKYDNRQIVSEAKILFPQIENVSIATRTSYGNRDSINTATMLFYKSKRSLSREAKGKLALWARQRLQLKQLEIYKEN